MSSVSSREIAISAAREPLSAPADAARPDASKVRDRDFIASLESVRGLAAMAVALFHAFYLLPVDGERVFDQTLWSIRSLDVLLMRLIMVPFNGEAAVSLFFVLSGFVLALSLSRDRRPIVQRAWGFAGRRVLRIYPALAVNLILFAGILALLAGRTVIAFPRYSVSDLVTNLLLVKPVVNAPSWTLQFEMLAIPFIFIAHVASRRFGLPGILALVAISIAGLFSPGLVFRTLFGAYLFMFLLGVLVAELGVRGLISMGRPATGACVISALATLMSARFLCGYTSFWSLLLEGASAAILVGALAHGTRLKLHDFLERPAPRFLGRVSYSYYLYHPLAFDLFVPIVVWLCSRAVLEAHPFIASTFIAVVTVIAAVPMATASYRLIERPMIALGRRF